MEKTAGVDTDKGSPMPFGVSSTVEGTNFALFARHATQVTLCLFNPATRAAWAEIPLDPRHNRTGDVWHIVVKNLPPNLLYAYRIDGPSDRTGRHIYDPARLILDPYAKNVASGHEWNAEQSYQPLGRVVTDSNFDWGKDSPPRIAVQDLIIYELHVRGFTQHPSSGVKDPGTFLGLIEKIPYLKELGVNAVEIMPAQEFDETECKFIDPHNRQKLVQYWGYSTVNFFSPMNRYAKKDAIEEFKMMVKALHKQGIEVILDVVLNHTSEGGLGGPIYSFKGIDNSIYYMLDSENQYLNFSGCGNTLNCNHPVVRQLIIDCLRYWITEMHVDGFRFDLASIFNRDTFGQPISYSPLVEQISQDPIISKTKLIAEPWDAAGLYQIGAFYPQEPRWSEWNGKYRDAIRQFLINHPNMKGRFATRISGSEDLFHARGPFSSINFVTVHDGFTLSDLVSYNHKHNMANGENNQDGTNFSMSWNCGVEGASSDEKILALRNRQMRNFHLALMISQGVPLLLMGDEYGHTKKGNNNTWCQDNDLNWFLWDEIKQNPDFFRFYKMMIEFRKNRPLLRRDKFLKENDIHWHGPLPFHPSWEREPSFLAFSLVDLVNDHDIYVAFNTQEQAVKVEFPQPPPKKIWHWIANTANLAPNDILADNETLPVNDQTYLMPGRSAIILEAKNP